MPPNLNKKILAIQFKYLGDVVFITPALHALKAQFPQAELHVLVAKEVAPLLENLTWITKIWAMPRTRGKFKLAETLPFIYSLRKENFDRSVDFGGNDRGAIASLLCGAKIRLASTESRSILLQKMSYTQTIQSKLLPTPWVERHLQLLYLGWNTPIPALPQLTITSDAKLNDVASRLLPLGSILCHISTSQIKKEWPIKQWLMFYQLATKQGYQLVFSAGNNEREQALLTQLKQLNPTINTLAPITSLSLFLAVINQAGVVIAGDTGPLHFAAGLGVKVIGLFGTDNSVTQAAPNYQKQQVILGHTCTCIGALANYQTCQSQNACMDSISPNAVLRLLLSVCPL
jgi:heptosyltransferase-3